MTTRQSLQMLLSRPMKSSLFPTRGQLRDVGYLVAGNALKIGLGFLTSAAIFRTLGANDAGRLTLALGLVGLISIVGEFGLRDAAVTYIARFLPRAPEKAYSVARTFLVSKIFLSLLASVVGILGAGFIAAQFYPEARIGDLVRLGACSLLTSGLLAYALVILEARQEFAWISGLSIVQTLLRAALVGLLFFTRSINVWTLVLLEAVIPLAVFIYSLRVIPRPFYALRLTLIPLPSISLEYLGLLLHFTKWIALAALASAFLAKLDVLMLSYYRAPAEVGFYAVALALVGRLDVVENAVLTTAFPEACRHTSPKELRSFVRQSFKLTGLASVALLPLFVAGGYIIQWLYGTEYQAAIPAFNLLLVGFLISLNAQPAAFVLYPLNRPKWIAASDLVQLAFNVAANLILIPILGIIGAALGVLLTRVCHAVITFLLVSRLLHESTAL